MVRGYYPFHPATVRALPALADQLGYKERSIAQYLSMGKDVPGFGQFIQGPLFEDDRGDLRLITLDRLFAYFEVRLRDDKPPIYSRYEQAMATVTDELSRRLLKTLALCDVLEVRTPLMPTEENLVRLLNLTSEDTDSLVDVQRRLQDLVDNGFVYVDGQGHYKLSASAGLSLSTVNRAVAQRKQAISSSGVPIGAAEAIPAIENAVKTALSLRNHNFQSPQKQDLPFSNDTNGERKRIKSGAYQNRFKLDREFTVQLVSRQQLQELRRKVALDRKNAQYDTILVVIATDTDSQQNDIDQVRQNARILSLAGMTVGVPKTPLNLSDAIREVKAADQVARDELYRNSQFAERALWDRQSRLLSQLINEVRVDAFEWYTPDLAAGDQPFSAKSLVEIVDKTAIHLGRGFPFGITVDNLVGTRLYSEVITSLLQSREIQLTRSRRKPQKDRIIRDALAPIGLINIANGGVTAPTDAAEVIKPDSASHADTRAIWDLLDTALGTGGSSQTIARVVNSLSHEPYWLPKDMGIYILSAFVGFYELHVYKAGDNIPCTAEILKKLWEDPISYTLKPAPRTPLSPEARLLLDDLQVVLIDVLPQAKLKRIELKNATSLSEDQLVVLSRNIHTWDTIVGIKAREITKLFGLTLPFPLKEWLAFLEEIEGGQIDRDQGETYTINLAKRIIKDPTAAKVLAGSLDHQVRQLQKLVDEAPMLYRAAAATQKPAATAQFETAWNAFRADPLNEIRRRELQTALTVVNIEAELITTPKGLSEEKTAMTIHDGSKIEYGAELSGIPLSTSTQNNIQADDLAKPINTSTLLEVEADKRHIDDWRASANTIAKVEINADALQRCISLMQQLVVHIKESGTMPSGEFVLTQVVTALKSLED